ncbi:MAG TPA: hypothetical protein VGH28_27720 [Polyangiaceae bacterium]|jgi:hypothetical protein
MRLLALAVVACAACCPYENAGYEWVPVRVRVYNGEAAVATVAQRSPSADPCDAPRPDIATCTPVATVRVRDLERDPRCYYDTKVTEGEIGRLMQCPSGQMIVFERASFVGPRAGGFVDACTTSTYDLPQGDSCTWRTEQRIQGSLSTGLTFSYVESPVAGRECTLACRQRGSLDVLR